jgi:hypothetical protein
MAMLSADKLVAGETFEFGDYHCWWFNQFRASLDWSADGESGDGFDTYQELVHFLNSNAEDED